VSNKYGVPGTQAAAYYNGGPKNYKGPQAQKYENSFDQRAAMMMNLVNCMR
jgi:hypothetical protein